MTKCIVDHSLAPLPQSRSLIQSGVGVSAPLGNGNFENANQRHSLSMPTSLPPPQLVSSSLIPASWPLRYLGENSMANVAQPSFLLLLGLPSFGPANWLRTAPSGPTNSAVAAVQMKSLLWPTWRRAACFKFPLFFRRRQRRPPIIAPREGRHGSIRTRWSGSSGAGSLGLGWVGINVFVRCIFLLLLGEGGWADPGGLV